MNKVKNTDITLEQAKELCKNYGRTLNNHILLINNVAPMVSTNGVLLSKDAQAEAQKEINKKGMLVVFSSDGAVPSNTYAMDSNAIYEGERVLYNPNSMVAFMTTIHTEELLEGLTLSENVNVRPDMYKSYVIICMHKSNLACTIK